MHRTVLFLAMLGAVLLGLPVRAQTNGIFADFKTNMGSFTCRLEYAKSPQAVASFIGLATGARNWVDLPTGQLRTNQFYKGLIFHRVIPNFMIQGGSPNGQGTDGPGYVFPDQFDPTLRHDGPGVLSMANSGPNSNGAQFFVTVTNTPWLDNVHIIFGRVIAGQDVVNAISEVPTDANNKPLTDVVLKSVTIRRVGAEAQAFNIDGQNLPVVSTVPLTISAGTDEVTLRYTNSLYADNRLCQSTNLTQWTGTSLGVDIITPVRSKTKSPTDVPARFFTMTRVQYPSSTFAPRDVYNQTMALDFGGGEVVTIAFDAANGGTYNYPAGGDSGTITSYTWTQDIYRGYLWPIIYSGGLGPMTLRHDFRSETNGTFTGTYYPRQGNSFGVSGSFTLSAP